MMGLNTRLLCLHKKGKFGWVWWCIPVIPVLGRLKEEEHEFEAGLGYIVRIYLKNK
jgi:hypothetical protein